MKRTITIQRISSLSLLKLLFFGGVIFWVFYVVGSFIYLLVGGDLYLPYSVGDIEKVTSLATGAKIFFVLAIVVAVFDFLFLFGVWLVAALGLWIYSKIRPISISYYETDIET